jgi:hypothetical protein
LEAVKRGNVPSAAAHAITVSAAADPGRLDSILSGIDFDAVAALVR